MSTIQQAMSNSAKLLDAAANGAIDPAALTAQVTELLSSNLGARGFMAALASADLPENSEIRAALIEAIKAGQANSYELIIKNIIMSGCAAQEHERNGRPEQAKQSQATSARSLELAHLCNDQTLANLAQAALNAISQWPPSTRPGAAPPSEPAPPHALATQNAPAVSSDQSLSTEQSSIAYWHQFFERWNYSEQYLAAVKEPLSSIARKPG